ncbi:MAG: IclR family transcriptional regulator [Alphaproteobacteria bacterium]|nr:IclR family transcriptional regulator [Alphaproteobacteria bacterium]
MVQSVEKAFRVLLAFDVGRETLSLSQVADATGLDKSAAQRFTHTLLQLGYLRKDAETRRYGLTPRTLDLAYRYSRSSSLVEQAQPFLLHLSRTTEETVNLTMLDRTHVIFVSRLVSHHVLNTDVMIGSRRPAFCTAPGIALLSRLPAAEAKAILEQSELRPYTPHTVWQMPAILQKMKKAAADGYAAAVEEIAPGDITTAAAILGADGRPVAAISISTSRVRFEPDAAIGRFAPLVVAAAQSMSRTVPIHGRS